MYPATYLYDDWLYILKINLAISDNLRDGVLIDYIELARKNIWTQYYELELINGEVPEDHPWAYDLKTKLATLHLAALYFENPDTNLQGDKIIDNRMLYRILGERVVYAK